MYIHIYTYIYLYSHTVVEVPDKAKRAHKNLNPRPIIPTMAVSVLSNNSKSYVACPPNSREVSHLTAPYFTASYLALTYLSSMLLIT